MRPPRWLIIAVASIGLATACGGDDDSCYLGEEMGCRPEQNGPREYRYCQVDETWSECTPEVLCDPLAQTGCPEGLVCHLASISTTICVPAETLPCSPGEAWGSGVDDDPCQPHCVSAGPGNLNEDPEHCAPGELCQNSGLSHYEAVGVCYHNDYGDG